MKKKFQVSPFKLNKYKIELDETLSLVSIQGPESKNILNKIIPGCNDLKFMNGKKYIFDETNLYLTRSGYTGEDGFEISIKNEDVVQLVEKMIKFGSKMIAPDQKPHLVVPVVPNDLHHLQNWYHRS